MMKNFFCAPKSAFSDRRFSSQKWNEHSPKMGRLSVSGGWAKWRVAWSVPRLRGRGKQGNIVIHT